MNDEIDNRVSRKRYQREQNARAEAESLLEAKSRELYLVNQSLSSYSASLEEAVEKRTAQLAEALKRAEAASTARSRFIATMSHEIRTPLGGLLGMIDLLSMGETDFEKKELLEYAKLAGRGLNRIVNDVLDFSKMEAGVFVFQEEHVDIRALVESVCVISGSIATAAKREITIEVSDSVPQLFWGDATRIRQVISNYISNAQRYSEDGPIIIRAEAKSHPKGALLKVSVEDFGVGIDPAKVGSLFQDFSQISNALTAAAQGAGLGLAICKRILEGCGGRVGVESELGAGSTFWFELPVAVIDDVEAANRKSAKGVGDATGESLKGKRVLIAEDNIINQKMLLTYVDRLGMVAELAENGRIALDKFAPDKFDVVLMDVAMPEMDGLEATRRIRQKWAGHTLPPIMILTAHVMDAIEEEALSVGITHVLSKPIPYDELRAALILALDTDEEAGKPVTPPTPEDPKQDISLRTLMAPNVLGELLEMLSIEDISDLVGKYVVDSSERLALIITALDAGDAEPVTSQAHSIKGSSLVLGFEEVSKLAHFIEKCDPAADKKEAQEAAADIEARLAEIDAALKL